MNKQLFQAVLWCLLSAFLLGISQPLFMPELFLAPWSPWCGLFALIGYVPFFLALRTQNLKTTFLLSLLTMTAQFSVVLFWIYIAVHVYGHVAPLPAATITLMLPMILALMGSVFFTVARFLSMHYRRSFLYFAPVALCAAEYFRNYHLFGGFPWGNVGYSLGRIPEFLQLASLAGVYGMVFFVGGINALLAQAFLLRGALRRQLFLASFILVTAAFIFGLVRLNGAEHEYAPSIRVAMVQGNIPQQIKSSARLYAEDIIAIYEGLNERAVAQEAQLIVWPESVYPQAVYQKNVQLTIKASSVASVIGATTYTINDDGQYYQNSALIFDHKNKLVDRYDKSHLVPFGEYVPWPLNSIVDKIVPGMGAFRPGTNFKPVDLHLSTGKSVAIGTTVCYEGIFPEISRAYAKNGAQLLVNLTNDAWYGTSSAPYQHLLMYQVRSAESGRPYVRATNSGISAWVDAYGRLHDQLPLFVRDILVADVPLVNKSTLYLIVGDSVPIICLLVLMIAFITALIPLKEMVQQRRIKDLAIVALFVIIALSSHWYFSDNRFMAVESAQTKNLWIIILSMVVMIGCLTKSQRSKAILLAVATFIGLVAVLLAVFESVVFLWGLLISVLIYLLAFRMKSTLSNKPQ